MAASAPLIASSLPPRARTDTLTRVMYGVLVLVYLTCFPYHPALRSPNELCRLWQSRALVEDSSLDINAAMRRYGPVGDLSLKDGKYYPSKAPLLSFAAAPIYAALARFAGPGDPVPEVAQVFWSRLLLTVLPTLVMLIYLRRFLLEHVSQRATDWLVPTYALGSLALHYSWLFVSHQTTAVLVFGAFYALYRLQQRAFRPRGYLLAGTYAAAAVACEYTAALPVVALAIFALHGELRARQPGPRGWLPLLRASALALVGAAPFLIALLAYHQAAFGHPLHSGYKYLADVEYQPWHVGGFLGIGLPRARDLIRSFVSPLRGLFTISPFLLLAIPGCFALQRKRAQLPGLVLLNWLLLAGYTYFTASFSYSSWGWAAGPRHMTPWLPLLCLPVGLTLDALLDSASPRGVFARGIAAALCALSIAVAGAVAMVNYIPDILSTAFFGAVVPLMRARMFPASVFSLLGLPNPLAGLLILAAIIVSAGLVWLGFARTARASLLTFTLGSALTASVYLGLLAHATRHDREDEQGLALLQGAWWTRPGVKRELWPAPPPPRPRPTPRHVPPRLRMLPPPQTP